MKRSIQVLVLFISALASAQDTNYYTPAQYLAMQPKPIFAPGHHLPRLTTDGVQLTLDTSAELATNWGYALDLGSGLSDLTGSYANTNWPFPYQLLQLAMSDTNKFPVCLHVDRFWPYSIPTNWTIGDGMWVTNADGMIVDSSSNVWSNDPTNYSRRVVSPEASDSVWTNVAALTANPLTQLLSSNINIAMVMNDGEYGLATIPAGHKAWDYDPRVIAAMATNGLLATEYISNQKARQMGFVTAAVRAAVPARQLYIFYNTGTEQSRYTSALGWTTVWGWSSIQMNPTTDLPSFENYFTSPTSFTNPPDASISKGYDLLTKHLNACGYDIAIGATNAYFGHTNLNYSWVTAGWAASLSSASNQLADIPTYMGFLKCLYTSGMVGANAGYYVQPPNTTVPSILGEWSTNYNAGVIIFNGTFPTNIPPHWLLQEISLSRVHALFSYEENYLFNGDLLPGDGVNIMSTDQPSYEFTNNLADRNIRTLARKMHGTNEWLITCWAPYHSETNITVNIPTLGAVNLVARPSGAVYIATPTTMILQDTNGILPTEWMSSGGSGGGGSGNIWPNVPFILGRQQ